MKADERREERIAMGVVVDAYGSEERAMGWYCYLEQELSFPLQAKPRHRKAGEPQMEAEIFEVVGMEPIDKFDYDMYVIVDFGADRLAKGLSKIEPVEGTDRESCEAIMDWHYWIEQSYQF